MSAWYGERPEDRYVAEPNPFPLATAPIGPSAGVSGCVGCGMGEEKPYHSPFAEPGDLDYNPPGIPDIKMPEMKINPKTVAAAKKEIAAKKAAEDTKKGSMLPWLLGGAALFFILK